MCIKSFNSITDGKFLRSTIFPTKCSHFILSSLHFLNYCLFVFLSPLNWKFKKAATLPVLLTVISSILNTVLDTKQLLKTYLLCE